jgi:hypothetical protein
MRYPGGVESPSPAGGCRKDGWVLVADAGGN